MFQRNNHHGSTSTPNDEFGTMQSRLFVVCSQGHRLKVSWIKDNFKLKALLCNEGHKKENMSKPNDYTMKLNKVDA